MATLLVIEDSAGQRAEMRDALAAGGLFDRILEAHDGIEGLKLLLRESPDLVVCDLEMPGLDGDKLLRMTAATADAGPAIPFLVLTAVADPARRSRLIEQGAADVILKPFWAADLVARVGLHLKLLHTQRELLARNAELTTLSRTDALTGLANRRVLDEVLDRASRRLARHAEPYAVVLADVDFFKGVNDRYGHAVGDAVLRGVGATTGQIARATDVAGRFGGEEFLVVLENTPLAGARIFAERWRRAVEALRFDIHPFEPFGISVSVGLSAAARTQEVERERPEEVVRRADAALYEAKSAGRNCVRVTEVPPLSSAAQGAEDDRYSGTTGDAAGASGASSSRSSR